MPKERISMRKIKEVLRLRFECKLSHRKIALSINIGQSTVTDYLGRATVLGLSWPLPVDLNDEKLEKLFFPKNTHSGSSKPLPDLALIHKELKRKGVTLNLLWKEYIDSHPDGYGYSRFCDLYNSWAKERNVWMPQHHKAGDKLFIDWAGMKIPVYSDCSDQVQESSIFVGSLGASNYTYIEAVKNEQLAQWISCHENMFSFFKGVPALLVPDNLLAGVRSSHLYEPDLNQTYLEMAQHYDTCVMPARVRRPQDKGKVEKAVLDVERQILASIRNIKFFSIAELNQTLSEKLKEFNEKPFQKLPGSRKSLFEELDKPVLRSLPDNRYEFGYWEKKRVLNNYHIDIQGHFYSVPYKYSQKRVEIRYNARVVQVFYRGKQIACHKKEESPGQYSTNPEHPPQKHKKYAEMTPEKVQQEAQKIGNNAICWIEHILSDATSHIFPRIRICVGALGLAKKFGSERLDAACKRAIHFGAYKLKNLESILKNNLEDMSLPEQEEVTVLPQDHDNIRGPDYYD